MILEGYKTYIAGFGAIIVGIIGLVIGLVDPTNPLGMDANTAVLTILGGLATIGIGRKIDKMKITLIILSLSICFCSEAFARHRVLRRYNGACSSGSCQQKPVQKPVQKGHK